MKQHPTALCYNLNGERLRRVRLLAMRLGIRLRPVGQEEYNQSIAALLDLEQAQQSAYEGEGFQSEMLVMAFFPSALINNFLNEFRQARIPSVKLKCVLTENNQKWDSLYLHRELSDEAAYFDAARKEAQSRKQASRILPLHQTAETEGGKEDE